MCKSVSHQSNTLRYIKNCNGFKCWQVNCNQWSCKATEDLNLYLILNKTSNSSKTIHFTLLTSVLIAACLVVDGAGVQLFRFLSPNTGRGTLRSPVKSLRKHTWRARFSLENRRQTLEHIHSGNSSPNFRLVWFPKPPIYNPAFTRQKKRFKNTSKGQILSADTFVCFVREVEVVMVVVAERAFLTSIFREAEEDVVVEEEDEEGCTVVDCCGGRGRKVEAVVVLGRTLGCALPRCVVSCFPVDPPPFCDALCFTTFSSSIWVSAVPWARPKSTSAYLHTGKIIVPFCVILFTWIKKR